MPPSSVHPGVRLPGLTSACFPEGAITVKRTRA